MHVNIKQRNEKLKKRRKEWNTKWTRKTDNQVSFPEHENTLLDLRLLIREQIFFTYITGIRNWRERGM